MKEKVLQGNKHGMLVLLLTILLHVAALVGLIFCASKSTDDALAYPGLFAAGLTDEQKGLTK